MCDVDDERIRTGAQHLSRSFEVVARGADSGGNPQATALIARGERMPAVIRSGPWP